MHSEMVILLVLTALGAATISLLVSLSANHQATAVAERALRGRPSSR